jgi:hypothetical protein
MPDICHCGGLACQKSAVAALITQKLYSLVGDHFLNKPKLLIFLIQNNTILLFLW